MRKIAKITIIISIFFNLFLFGIYFWALTDKIQNPEFKNLPKHTNNKDIKNYVNLNN